MGDGESVVLLRAAEANQNQEHRSSGAAFVSLNVNGAAYQEQHMKANILISPEKLYNIIE